MGRGPLAGKRVLVTRAREQAGSLAAVLGDLGAEPLVCPAIEIVAPSDPAPFAQALVDVRAGVYGWVVFTSANAVHRTCDGLGTGGPGSAKLAAIGPATARALEKHGLRVDVVARESRGEGMAAAMIEALRAQGSTAAPPRILLPRAARAREVLPEALRAAGYAVDVVAVYETRPPPWKATDALAAELEGRRVDAVTFTSSSSVENLCSLLGPEAVDLLRGCLVASIGPVTTETARIKGVRVDVTSGEPTIAGLVRALVKGFESRAR